MAIDLTVTFAFQLDEAADALLQFEAAPLADQRIVSSSTSLPDGALISRVAAQDGVGERIWINAQGRVEVRYEALVEFGRALDTMDSLRGATLPDLPDYVVPYLMGSQYCPAAQFADFAGECFLPIEGAGARVLAIRDWVADNIAYTPGASGPETSATDTFHAGAGVCRDFAHLFVTLARASAIPARYAACYAPGVAPQDFHAVAQVFLADENGNAGWRIIDATGMADPGQTAIIGVGRDAGDVSFLTSFGPMQFLESKVEVAVHSQPSEPQASKAAVV
ncbi:MAG: transglutaminase family protein [Erythrobacter sp.]|nr:transglutaminase family protein [Erythrobacter sp.]MDJ0978942.1 transglutaminase family protein [Erythrobacter sp.]